MIKKNLLKNKNATIWISGVTASGKTTFGKLLYQGLKDFGIENIKFLDGEDLRKRLTENYGHSLEERFILVEKWIKIAKEETIAIINNSAAGIPPKADGRDLSKSIFEQLMKFKERNLPTNKALRALKADMSQYF